MNIKLIAKVILAIVIAIVASYLFAGKNENPIDEVSNDVAELRPLKSASENPSKLSRLPVGIAAVTDKDAKQSVVDHATQIANNGVEGPRWPDGVENLILDYFSQLEGFEFTIITSVRCQIQTCEIVFSGTNPNPKIVDEFMDVPHGLYLPPLNAQQGSMGTREIAAGVREYVIKISNVPHVEPINRQ